MARGDLAGYHAGRFLPGELNELMTRAEFEAIVQEALDHLPEWVHEALEHIEIVIQDEAGEDVQEAGEDLLGLYVGVPLTERSVEDAGDLPDIIYIFRQPHLDMGLPHEELCEEIAKTLVHEIAHYFGIEDDHLDEIGWG